MDYRCAHCNSKTVDVVAHWITDEGDLWRVPVKICTNPDCLKRQGAILQQKEKREHPELKDAPSLVPSEWALTFTVPPTP